MRKFSGFILVALGAVLILAALSLLLYNRQEDRQAGKEAEILLQELQAAMEQEEITATEEFIIQDPDAPEEDGEVPEVPGDPTMTEVKIGRYLYVGYLSIPVLELELPIISTWSYEKLQTAPCRQYGSTKTDDLVIAAHNYSTHFGRIKDLQAGDSITFTDMDGEVIYYEVVKVDTIYPGYAELVQDSEHHLILYTCTTGGANRIVVFADRAEPRQENIME